ncbi:MAG TPA: FimV/HubP family polar landmark protein [Rhodanobacteraceae bacterium]
MKSTFKLTLAIALCLGSSQALALQLGQIRVKSALDERLVAEIPIQLDTLGEAKSLSVGLASDADFARAGLSRGGLEHLRFSIVNDTTGHKLVLVTSDQAITDPYLDFLLEVNTAKGKQLREYTVLLDPVIASSPAPQVTAAPATAVPATRSATPVAPAASQAAAATPPPASMFAAPVQQPRPAAAPAPAAHVPWSAVPAPAPTQSRAGQYQVKSGDTLYHIASETRPDAQVSVDQMMLALQRTNPDAFYRANINTLKSGAILRIPTRDAVNATSLAEARAQVHRQMEDWRGTAARKATTVVQGNSTAAEAAPAQAPATHAADRLALVPPAQGGGSAASRPGEKGGTGTAEIAGLKQQLATAKESLASLKQANGDLQSRVKDLEDIGSKNKKLLDMKDAEIAELQRKLAQAQEQAAKTVATPSSNNALAAGASAGGSSASAPKQAANVAAAPAAAGTAAAQATATAASANAAASSTAQAAAKTSPAAKPEAKAVPQDEQSQGIAEPWYRKPLTWIIAGVVILGLILLGLVRRRPKPLPEPESEGPSLADHFGAAAEPVAADTGMHDMAAHDEPEYAEDDPGHAVVDEASDETVMAPVAGHAQEPAQDEYDFAFEDLPPEEQAQRGMASPSPAAAGGDDITHVQSLAEFGDDEAQPVHHVGSPVLEDEDDTREHPVPAFSDDPVDTKLDLARAYLDMGDPAGARAMLEEVLNEGSQMQKDEAKRLLEGVA